jgi:cephalosporin-C deacetylase-like acetyl esterase
MRATFLILLLCLPLAATAAHAQQRDTAVSLAVELDHADWVYAQHDTARFRVRLLRAGRPVPGAVVRLAVGVERLSRDSVTRLDAGSGGWQEVRGMLPEPGFLRGTATAVVAGVTYEAMATAAFAPERIEASVELPADFTAFWDTAIAAARRVPLEPVLTRLPERSTDDVDVYHVSFQNHRAGSRLYGMLSVPRRAGRFPAMLVVPGAGVRPYFPSVETAKRGVIHLAIGIHGIPVDRDSLLYNELRATALQSYATAGVEDRDRYYYKRVFVGVVRAGDFLFGLPQFDGEHYAVQGGSQGGGLAIVAAALDPRVKAISASYPALSDHLAYLHGRTGGWPHIFADTASVRAKAEKVETLRYYDVVNFARRVQVPGIYAWGFNDTVVPPRSMYAAYNQIRAPRQVLVHPPSGHNRTPDQVRRMNEWLLAQLGVGAH